MALFVSILATFSQCTPNIRQVKIQEQNSLLKAQNVQNHGIAFFRFKSATLGGSSRTPSLGLAVNEGVLPNFANPDTIDLEPKTDNKTKRTFIDECVLLFGNTAEYRFIFYSEHSCTDRGRVQSCSYYLPKVFTKRAFQLNDGDIVYLGTLNFNKYGDIENRYIESDKAYCAKSLQSSIQNIDVQKIKNRTLIKYHE
ncbi:hypothetical protein CH352_16110 [Leptospira hartskeerlii]|uniref:Uncharacterized protein n=1 Tax=Leptospira hartskeerlii TaxID=2023177 RepID=A0A2M9X9B6_9LEPT|nr:hypothetical protein [Leptospira hartskeerlii]PJZ24288.1 hypothetical protein CH357_16605 [Leptospira hartskeerlii]PJZ32473.1 hypothetical protein CH352_16110 [Leptospira hartskeerlii]